MKITYNPTIEICAYSLESCLAAQEGGAHRIELCSSMYEGGTTPSVGFMQVALKAVSLEIHAMIRPRGGDFCYSPDELAIMETDIKMAKQVGCSGIVLGILTPEGKVNVAQTAKMVAIAQPMPVTFHRAIDMTPDYSKALEQIIEAGCRRILTSGQANRAIDGLSAIKQLVQQANGRIEVMAGSGINAKNALTFIEAGVNAIHLSAKATRDSVMKYRKEGIAMGGLSEVPEYEIAYADVSTIREVVQQFS
jgi:copper homeostasis protein